PLSGIKPAGHRRTAQHRPPTVTGRPADRSTVHHPWLAAVSAGAAALAIATGMFLIWSQHSLHGLASTCTKRSCQAPSLRIPAGAPLAGPSDAMAGNHLAGRHSPARANEVPAKSSAPLAGHTSPGPQQPTATPSPAGSQPNVSISYTLV